MKTQFRILFSGFVISFLGTLPLGTINTTAFQIAASQNISEAFLFATAVIIVELIIVRITLLKVLSIDINTKISTYVLPFAIVLLVYLSVTSIFSANNQEPLVMHSTIFPMIKSTFLLGLIMSILNPMHVPFWLTWNGILVSRKQLYNYPANYSSYILGIGIGSLSGLLIYVMAGHLISSNYQHYSHFISLIMGVIYLIFAAYLVYRFYKNHLRLAIS